MKKVKFRAKKGDLQLLGILLLSVLAATIIFIYTTGIESRFRSQQELISTLVVEQRIPVGTSLATAFSSGLIQTMDHPRQFLPPLAITSVNDSNRSLVALHELQPGQLVTTPNFGEKATNTSALKVPMGMLAVTVMIGEPEKVASFLQPGSEIAIFGTKAETSGTRITSVIFPQVTVLAIGNQILADTSGQAPATSSVLITLAVTPAQALKLIHAARTESLYFALRSDGVEIK